MSRKILANPYTGEMLKEPLIVTEDHVLHPEDFYNREVEHPTLDTLDEDGFDQVNNPTHYQSMTPKLHIDAISCMRAAFGDEEVASFCICNAMKYLFRHESKGGKTDLLKCKWYIDKYLELNK